jgi:hypothetical protein
MTVAGIILRARHTRTFALALACALLAGCGNAQGTNDKQLPEADPPGAPVNLMLSDSEPAPPARVGDVCVVFAPDLPAAEVWYYQLGRVPAVFQHIGDSIRSCMAGTAAPYLGELPATHFYEQLLFINLDGSCPIGASGCYWPLNPTIDRAQTTWALDPAAADAQVSTLVGHEVWHAVAGNYHP